jgi:COMPASS component SWD2
MTEENQLITKNDIKKLAVAHQAKVDAGLNVKSIDFQPNGEVFVFNSCSAIHILILTDLKVYDERYNVKQYIPQLCRFIDDTHIIHSSDKDHELRLLSLDTKKYVRVYSGHSARVTSLSVHDKFVATSSKDSTVRVWNASSRESINNVTFSSPPLVAFHPFGEFLAVARESSIIEIYEKFNFLQSVNQFKLDKNETIEWTRLKFSDDGRMLMITTNASSILVIDLATGEELNNFRDYDNPLKENIDACFTTGSGYVVGGNSEGVMHVWDCKTSLKVHSLKRGLYFQTPISNITFNPKFMNLGVSRGSSVELWNEKF